jgi:hypothetical protein
MKTAGHLLAILCMLLVGAKNYGTEIILDQASDEIFPESWRGGKVSASADKLLDSEVERLRAIIDRALAKYPKDFLDSTLKKVYGLGRLEYFGVVTGGTRSADSIYVVCKPHFSDEAVERIIHAEYSSILFMKFEKQFDSARWLEVNPPGFEYLGSGSAAVKAGKTSKEFNASNHKRGFLTEYSQASIEEDFNAHVAHLFMGDEAYWKAVRTYPKLKAKSDLVIGFYKQLHKAFNGDRFQQIRRGKGVAAGVSQ